MCLLYNTWIDVFNGGRLKDRLCKNIFFVKLDTKAENGGGGGTFYAV
jgi:hypothetical protein